MKHPRMCGGLSIQLNPVARKDVNLKLFHLFGLEKFILPKLKSLILCCLQKRKCVQASHDLFSFCLSFCFRKPPAPLFWIVCLKKKKASETGNFPKVAIQITFFRRLHLSTFNILSNLPGLARPIFDHTIIICPVNPQIRK